MIIYQNPGHFPKLKKSAPTEFSTLKKRTCLGNTRRMATLVLEPDLFKDEDGSAVTITLTNKCH